MDPSHEITFGGHGGEFMLTVQVTPGIVVVRLAVRANGFAGAGVFDVNPDDWTAFVEAVQGMDKVLTGSAQIAAIAGPGRLRLEMDGLGHVRAEAEVPSFDLEQRLWAVLTSDQTYLKEFARLLRTVH